jgi:uncharacterized protein (TIRG00374 family)
MPETATDQHKPPEPEPAPDADGAGPKRAKTPNRDEMPRVAMTKRRVVIFVLFVAGALAFLYFGLPQIAGLGDTWKRLQQGSPWWFALAIVFKVASFAGYMWLFRAVFVDARYPRITWSASYQITMAGLAATRLFAAAGAGGVALTAWAVRRSGMPAREVGNRLVAFTVLTYIWYGAALFIDGILLRTGVLPGPAPFAVTVIPALIGGGITAAFFAIALIPEDLEQRLPSWKGFSHRGARWARRIATIPAATSSGVRMSIRMARAGTPGLLGGFIWWATDIATLWACFHAFGDPPNWAILIMAYFVGMLGNLLPLPGGIGGVDGGMIGALIAFGVDGGLAVVAVLSYRAFAFWLPTIPGVIAYLQLRRTVERWRTTPAQVASSPG